MKVRSCDGGILHEITNTDVIIESEIIAILCPICKNKAFKVEPDLYQCFECNELWSVE